MPARRFHTYDDFFPYYVAMHRRRATRVLHAVGTLSGLALAVHGLVRRRSPKALAWFPALGYGFAWPSHFLVEGNNPATFGYPAWSFRGDVAMIATMLRGRDAELGQIAERWFAENGADGSAGTADVPLRGTAPSLAP